MILHVITGNKGRFRPRRVAPLYANHDAIKLHTVVDSTSSILREYHAYISWIELVPNQGISITSTYDAML